jgi:hypothetical protein
MQETIVAAAAQQATPSKSSSRELLAITLPLLTFVVLVFAEAAIVHFIRYTMVGEWYGLPWASTWIAADMFIIGGFYLGMFEANHTNPDKPSKDPLLWLGRWIQRKFGWLALITNALLLGPMYTGTILKYDGNPRRLTRNVFWSSALYAVVWIPILVFVWK